MRHSWKKKLASLCLLFSISAPVLGADTSDAVYYQVSKFLPEPAVSEVTNDILDASAYYQVDPILIAALFTCESGFQESAISPAGAVGISQLMPDTASYLGVNPYDTRDNIFGGVAYLAQQLNTFGGDYVLAEAAYNAGPGAVQQYGGVPPYTETINYVDSVEAIRSAIWNENGNDITPYYDTGAIEADTEENDDESDDMATKDDVDVNAQTNAKKGHNGDSVQKKAEDTPETIRFYPPSAQ